MKKRGLEVVGAGVVAAVVIACGDAAMNGAGGMLHDAGEMMADAGQMMMDAGGQMMVDAGQMMMDAGGQVMVDAGEIVRDAGHMMSDAGGVMRDGSTGMMDSAAAQSCEACTAGGRQMVVTADSDLEQLRGGTVQGAGWTVQTGAQFAESVCSMPWQSRAYTKALVDGPFLLTDYRASQGTDLFTVPNGMSCYVTYTASVAPGCPGGPGFGSGQLFRRPEAARPLLLNHDEAAITGARILVPDGETLCVGGGVTYAEVSAAGLYSQETVIWSGFVPYE